MRSLVKRWHHSTSSLFRGMLRVTIPGLLIAVACGNPPSRHAPLVAEAIDAVRDRIGAKDVSVDPSRVPKGWREGADTPSSGHIDLVVAAASQLGASTVTVDSVLTCKTDSRCTLRAYDAVVAVDYLRYSHSEGGPDQITVPVHVWRVFGGSVAITGYDVTFSKLQGTWELRHVRKTYES